MIDTFSMMKYEGSTKHTHLITGISRKSKDFKMGGVSEQMRITQVLTALTVSGDGGECRVLVVMLRLITVVC
jgi:hypothetical protein